MSAQITIYNFTCFVSHYLTKLYCLLVWTQMSIIGVGLLGTRDNIIYHLYSGILNRTFEGKVPPSSPLPPRYLLL